MCFKKNGGWGVCWGFYLVFAITLTLKGEDWKLHNDDDDTDDDDLDSKGNHNKNNHNRTETTNSKENHDKLIHNNNNKKHN